MSSFDTVAAAVGVAAALAFVDGAGALIGAGVFVVQAAAAANSTASIHIRFMGQNSSKELR
jgi:hypothetical protein